MNNEAQQRPSLAPRHWGGWAAVALIWLLGKLPRVLALWLTEGSDQIPEKAKNAKVDPELGFAVHREDLGGGFQEMIFIFPKKLTGTKLKYAYLRSHIYRHLFSDFRLLATAGGDFEGKIVPDKHDEAYAHCGSQAGLDSFIVGDTSPHNLECREKC